MRRLSFWPLIIFLFFATEYSHAATIPKFGQILSKPLPELLLDTVNGLIRGKFRAKQMRFIAPATVVLSDVELIGERGQTIIWAQDLRTTVSVSSLLLGEIRLSSTIVTNAVVRLDLKSGDVDIARAFSSPTISPPIAATSSSQKTPRIFVDGIQVKNAEFEMAIENSAKVISHNIQISGNLSFINSIFSLDVASVTSSGGRVEVDKVSINYSNMSSTALSIRDTTLDVGSVAANVEGSPMVANGTLDWGISVFNLRGSIDRLQESWPKGISKPDFEVPQFLAQLHLRGPLNSPALDADLTFKDFPLFGFPITKGRLATSINEQGIFIHGGLISLKDSGQIVPKGSYSFSKNHLQISGNFRRLSLPTVFDYLDLSADSGGHLSGQFVLDTQLEAAQPFQLKIDAQLSEGAISGLQLPKTTKLTLVSSFKQDDYFRIHKGSLEAEGFFFSADGVYDIEKRYSDFFVSFRAQSPNRFVSTLPEGLTLSGLSLSGRVSGTNTQLIADSHGKFKAIVIGTTSVEDVSFDLKLNNDEIQILNVKGEAEDGRLAGYLRIKRNSPNQLEGRLLLDNVGFPAGLIKEFPISQGAVYVEIAISGTLENPHLSGNLLLTGTRFAQFLIKRASAQFIFHKNVVEFQNVELDGPQLKAKLPLLKLDVQKSTIEGNAQISFMNIYGFPQLAEYDITGVVSGKAEVSGSIAKPSFRAHLYATDVIADELKLGEGPLFLILENNILQVSTFLTGLLQVIDLRASLDLRSKKILGQLKLRFNDLAVFNQYTSAFLMPFNGELDGSVEISGTTDSPDLALNLLIPDLRLQSQASIASGEYLDAAHWHSLGPMRINATYKKNLVAASICGLPVDVSEHEGCTPDDRLQLQLNMRVDSSSRYSVHATGMIDDNNLEHFLRALNDELISVGAKVSFSLDFEKTGPTKQSFEGRLQAERFNASLPGVPQISLKDSLSVQFSDHELRLLKPAIFVLGQDEMRLEGHLGTRSANFHISGKFPLLIIRAITPAFTAAEGAAKGELLITGSTKAPKLKGTLIPDVGSQLTPRAGLETIVVQSGEFAFETTAFNHMVLRANNIDLVIGEGRAKFHGSVSFAPGESGQLVPKDWNLALKGESILAKAGNNWSEMDFDIKFQSLRGIDWISGEINVSDAYIYQVFSVQNFVFSLTRSGFAPSQLPNWLSDLHFNVDVNVQSFHLEADMVYFLADLFLAADLQLMGTARSPQLIGAVDLLEGSILFPAAAFTIEPTTIPFLNTPGKPVDPQIDISARTVLSPQLYDVAQNTTVELRLKGSLSQLDFSLNSLGDNDFEGDQVSLMKLLWDASAYHSQLTGELQDAVRKFTGSQLRIGSAVQAERFATYLQWQIGPRIEVEGATAADQSQLKLRNFRLRFLLFDHLPVGRTFSLEGAFEPPSDLSSQSPEEGVFRLKYRVFGP